MTKRQFGADFWGAGRVISNSDLNNGGYYDREKAESPQTHDRFGDPEDRPHQPICIRSEFPYGY